MPPVIFPQGVRLNTEAYIGFLEKIVLTWIGMLRLITGRQAIHHNQENAVLAVKISATTSILTYSCVTHQIAIPQIIMVGARLNDRSRRLHEKRHWKQWYRQDFQFMMRPLERLARDSNLRWRHQSKPLAVSLNKSNLWYFNVFSCNFGKYI